MDTRAEVAYQTYLSGDGDRLSVLFHTLRSDVIGDAGRVESDTQRIVFAADFRAAQAEHQAEIARALPLSTTTPDWVREMVILEMMPGFHGGFRGLADKLPLYREIGFNTLYLMPHWVGGYGNADPRQVDPAFGTPDDLKALVKRAHALGMRVLFDMVIHGFAAGGTVAREHPEFFTRNEQGRVETHFNWGRRGRGRKSTRPGANGVVELMPFEFLDRLTDLVPPPRKHRHRYHGVFAPNHKLRPAVTALDKREHRQAARGCDRVACGRRSRHGGLL